MASVPVMRTWVSGEVVTAAYMNVNIRDTGNYWLTGKPVCQSRMTATQSIGNSAFTAVNFDTDDYDNDSMHSTASNTSRFTCVTAGRYLFVATGALASNATGIRAAKLQQEISAGGISVIGGQSFAAGNTTESVMNLSGTCLMAVNDYVHLDVFQASGGALNTSVTYYSGSTGTSRMAVFWLHNA